MYVCFCVFGGGGGFQQFLTATMFYGVYLSVWYLAATLCGICLREWCLNKNDPKLSGDCKKPAKNTHKKVPHKSSQLFANVPSCSREFFPN